MDVDCGASVERGEVLGFKGLRYEMEARSCWVTRPRHMKRVQMSCVEMSMECLGSWLDPNPRS